MPKLQIVSPYDSFAMRKMSEPLLSMRDYEVEIVSEYKPGADIYYHIPFHTLVNFTKRDGEKHVILYTHMNPGVQSALVDACGRADAVVCMSNKGAMELSPIRSVIQVIYAGIDIPPVQEKEKHDGFNIGVVCFEQPNGRKRSHILLDLAWLAPNPQFHYMMVGGGMADVAQKMVNAGADVKYWEGVSDADMHEFYNMLDVLLVTGYIEGGPLTVLESMANDVPVISSDVGYAHDLLPRDCIYNTVEELIEKLRNFKRPDFDLREMVKPFTWNLYVEKHKELFDAVLKGDYADLRLHRPDARDGSKPSYAGISGYRVS